MTADSGELGMEMGMEMGMGMGLVRGVAQLENGGPWLEWRVRNEPAGCRKPCESRGAP